MRTEHQQRTDQSPVVEVLKAASIELRKLRDCHVQLNSRIRTLRTTMAALHKLQYSRDLQVTHQSVTSCVAPVLNPRLRRACRIALLEASEALSASEILRRIVRRGSYQFVARDSAGIAIAKELDDMAKSGEAERVACSFGVGWRRALPIQNPADVL